MGCYGRAEVTGLCTLGPSSPEEAESRDTTEQCPIVRANAQTSAFIPNTEFLKSSFPVPSLPPW